MRALETIDRPIEIKTSRDNFADIPLELRKHVGSIHISNRLSLIQRKMMNVLLMNAYPNLLTTETHQIGVSALVEMLGIETRNWLVLRGALRGLRATEIEWNILSSQGEQVEWGISSFLAEASIKNGKVYYSYGPEMRRRLYNPEIYAKLDLRIQARFGSSHALALYENCHRFRQVKQTPWIPVETLKKLLGVEGVTSYEAFKEFNRSVLKPAIKEVNQVSGIVVSMELRKNGRTISDVKFHIEENAQTNMPLLMPAIPQPLYNRLVNDFGFNSTKAIETITSYDENYITANLDEIERRLNAGTKVERLVPYVLDALLKDYRPREPELKKKVLEARNVRTQSQQRIEQQRSDSNRRQQEKVTAYMATLDEAHQQQLQEQFTDQANNIVRKHAQTKGFDHPIVAAAFIEFVARRISLN